MRFWWAIYDFLLYWMGFARNETITGQEHITDMLQRQKARMGKAWWAIPILTLAFLVWLTLHVAGVQPFGKPRRKVTT